MSLCRRSALLTFDRDLRSKFLKIDEKFSENLIGKVRYDFETDLTEHENK